MNKEEKVMIALVPTALFFLIGLVTLGMWGCPQYQVYEQGLGGLAALKKAEQDRHIKVLEAQAAEESAKHLAQAEIERAKGTAEANKIIGFSLKDNESYLRYLWIHNLNEGKNEVIYVPTEAGLPILEAGRRKKE